MIRLLGTLAEGARNAVEVCMSIKKGEHVLILTDKQIMNEGKHLLG